MSASIRVCVRVLPPDGDQPTPLHRHIVQQRAVRDVILEHQAELLLLAERVHFLLNPLPQLRVLNLADQIVDRRHCIHPFKTKASFRSLRFQMYYTIIPVWIQWEQHYYTQ